MVLACVLVLDLSAGLDAAQQTDEAFLDEVQRKSFDYFLECQHPVTGLVLDRANNFKKVDWDDGATAVTSTAAAGYALSAYVVGAERGWITRDEAYRRCMLTLKFYLDSAEKKWGYYYHFLDAATGQRAWESELSTIDTVLFLAGALTAGEYFKGTEVETIARKLYERVDWNALLSDDNQYISMGWNPEKGKLRSNWEAYCECMILYLMAIGSPTNPVPEEMWHAWKRPVGQYAGHISIAIGPLFTHQYSHIWIDFRGKHDKYADYFVNSAEATLANREFCIANKKKYRTYDDDVWGLTASDGPGGYLAYGGPPARPIHDGTVAPTAAGGSIVFTPELSIRCMKAMKERYGDRLWGRYGFSDAFNVDRGWFAPDVIGIDQGTILLMIENHRSELIWKLFMKQKWVGRALEKAGFEPGTKELTAADVTMSSVKIHSLDDRPSLFSLRPVPDGTVTPDGSLSEWPAAMKTAGAVWTELEYPRNLENGSRQSDKDLSAWFAVLRSPGTLSVAVKVLDNDVRNPHPENEIYRGDLVEIFLDPASDNLQWGSATDYQVGISPVHAGADGRPAGPAWFAWFQNGRPSGISAASIPTDEGYVAEAVFDWEKLGNPSPSNAVGISVAVHDVDADSTPEAKLQWFFFEPGIVIGKLIYGEPDTGLIASFNSESRVNERGGEFGAWQKDPADTTQGASMELVTSPAFGSSGRSLKIDYDVESPRPAFNGLWMKLNDFDASAFGSLCFRIRGDASAGIPKKIKIELKSVSEKASLYVDHVSPGWTEVVFPKTAFVGITDWSALKELVVVFEDRMVGNKMGAIYLDDVRFK